MKNLIQVIKLNRVAVFSITSILLFHAEGRVQSSSFHDDDKGKPRRNDTHRHQGLREVVNLNGTAAAASSCVGIPGGGVSHPYYKACTTILKEDGTNLTVMETLSNEGEQYRPDFACTELNGELCRGSYYCDNGNLALDCRNLFQPGETSCGAIDCDGNCIDYPATTSPPLHFDYSQNSCGKLGNYCVRWREYHGVNSVHCNWLSILPDGIGVEVHTREFPFFSEDCPDYDSYYGECTASVNGNACNNCSISCVQPSGNYAQFDCSNLIPTGSVGGDTTGGGGDGVPLKNNVTAQPTIEPTIEPTLPPLDDGTCVDHVGNYGYDDTYYSECNFTLDDAWDATLLRSLSDSENALCLTIMDGLPCRGSYVCNDGTLAWDCRNLFQPGEEPCGAKDCLGNCIDYPATTSEPLLFDYSNNGCGKIGYQCQLTDGLNVFSCFWLNILPDGTHVRVSTNEGPFSSIGNPDDLRYVGECFASVDGNPCNNCSTSCIQSNGNYAQFDCSNLITSGDACAVQTCSGCAPGETGGGDHDVKPPRVTRQPATMPPTIPSTTLHHVDVVTFHPTRERTLPPTMPSTTFDPDVVTFDPTQERTDPPMDFSCVDHVESFEPNYSECNFTLNDGSSDGTLLLSYWDTDYSLCVIMDALPCRESYLCDNGNVAWDCRNLLEPGEQPCGAKDCFGNCIDYPVTSEPLLFDYSNNGCGKLGYYCDGAYEDGSSCYWLNILPDGTQVRVSTNEGPYSSIFGNPDDIDYYGECFASVDGNPCNNCSISCIQSNGNYAQFDCSNLIQSGDPCAVQSCSGCAPGETGSGDHDVKPRVTRQPTTMIPTTTSRPTRIRTSEPTNAMPTAPPRPSTRLPTVRPSTNLPTVRPSTHPPKVRPSTNLPTVRPSTHPPKVRPSTKLPTIRPSTNPPKVRPSTHPPKVRPSTNPPTIPITANPPAAIDKGLACAAATRAVKGCKSGIFAVCNSTTAFSCAENEQVESGCETITCLESDGDEGSDDIGGILNNSSASRRAIWVTTDKVAATTVTVLLFLLGDIIRLA